MNLASSPQLVKEKVVINEAKLDDVFSLLKNRFGAKWRGDKKLSYFKQFYKSNYKPSKQERKEVDENDEDTDCCSCCGEDEDTFFL